MSLENLAGKINSAAKAEADEIINEANKQASEIINSAKNEAKEMEDNALIDPNNLDSTDLGEVPQGAKKGSIDPQTIFAPYLYGRFAY